LIVGALALLFAPGRFRESSENVPRAIAAAMLAPTTLDQATPAPVTQRVDDSTIPVLAVLGALTAVAASARRRAAPRADVVGRVADPPHRQPPRRGPPALTV
jgi:hypothetical protein